MHRLDDFVACFALLFGPWSGSPSQVFFNSCWIDVTLPFSIVCGSSLDLETFWKFRFNWISFFSSSISLFLTFLFLFLFDLFLLEDTSLFRSPDGFSCRIFCLIDTSWFRKFLMFNFFSFWSFFSVFLYLRC